MNNNHNADHHPPVQYCALPTRTQPVDRAVQVLRAASSYPSLKNAQFCKSKDYENFNNNLTLPPRFFSALGVQIIRQFSAP